MVNRDAYVQFINEVYHQKVVFLELGVGFNTPVIIRYPFERMTIDIEKAKLIQVNKSSSSKNKMSSDKVIEIIMDIDEFIKKVNEEEMF